MYNSTALENAKELFAKAADRMANTGNGAVVCVLFALLLALSILALILRIKKPESA